MNCHAGSWAELWFQSLPIAPARSSFDLESQSDPWERQAFKRHRRRLTLHAKHLDPGSRSHLPRSVRFNLHPWLHDCPSWAVLCQETCHRHTLRWTSHPLGPPQAVFVGSTLTMPFIGLSFLDRRDHLFPLLGYSLCIVLCCSHSLAYIPGLVRELEQQCLQTLHPEGARECRRYIRS